jgi:hypothetical protein
MEWIPSLHHFHHTIPDECDSALVATKWTLQSLRSLPMRITTLTLQMSGRGNLARAIASERVLLTVPRLALPCVLNVRDLPCSPLQLSLSNSKNPHPEAAPSREACFDCPYCIHDLLWLYNFLIALHNGVIAIFKLDQSRRNLSSLLSGKNIASHVILRECFACSS